MHYFEFIREKYSRKQRNIQIDLNKYMLPYTSSHFWIHAKDNWIDFSMERLLVNDELKLSHNIFAESAYCNLTETEAKNKFATFLAL